MRRFALIFLIALVSAVSARADTLIDYLSAPEAEYSWSETGREKKDEISVIDLSLTSQTWQSFKWQHNIKLLVPPESNSDTCLLWISGSEDGSKSFEFIKSVVIKSGFPAAIVTHVPNQPLFDGRKEDALLAFTFHKFTESGEANWPIIFPMVKSAVKAMDALEDFSSKKLPSKFTRFIVAGASKRGWTTWLSAAVDKRVVAIAPFVFDMLNMKMQIELMKRSYGKESEKIKDYTNMGLVERIDQPRTTELILMVDPYVRRKDLTVPKLIMLGTNDPYWVVDSLRNYLPSLHGSTLIYQAPNAGHSISSQSAVRSTLVGWLRLVSQKAKLPRVSWSKTKGQKGELVLEAVCDCEIKGAQLWSAEGQSRDFRDSLWSSQKLIVRDKRSSVAVVAMPEKGYKAAYIELNLSQSDEGFRVSTQAFVLPDLEAYPAP